MTSALLTSVIKLALPAKLFTASCCPAHFDILIAVLGQKRMSQVFTFSLRHVD